LASRVWQALGAGIHLLVITKLVIQVFVIRVLKHPQQTCFEKPPTHPYYTLARGLPPGRRMEMGGDPCDHRFPELSRKNFVVAVSVVAQAQQQMVEALVQLQISVFSYTHAVRNSPASAWHRFRFPQRR